MATMMLFSRADSRMPQDSIVVSTVVRTAFGQEDSGRWMRAMSRVVRPLMKTPEEGARTPIHLAASPDVEGVAPAWFGLAECDPLVDDGIAYADTLRAAGVAVELEIYRGVTHEFIKMGRALPEARQAHADAAAALTRALHA